MKHTPRRPRTDSRKAAARSPSDLHEESLRPMLFVHIPKTAGTSLRQGVTEFLGQKRVVLDYGPKQPVTSRLVQRWRYKESDPERLRTAFDAQGKKFLSGHICLTDYIGSFDLDNVAVFLRDPVQRVISEHRHYVRHYGYVRSLEEFAETKVFQNKQARALAGVSIQRLGFVGMAERYEESLARLNEHFGWQVRPRKDNMGRIQLSEPYEVDKPTRRLLERNNTLDIALYESACRHFEQHDRSRCQIPSGPATGSCNLRENNIVHGWACQIGGEQSTTVRIEVNGTTVAHVAADLFRPNVRSRGLKRSGCAGFKLEIPSISPGDEIRCFETDGGSELHNSPLKRPEQD